MKNIQIRRESREESQDCKVSCMQMILCGESEEGPKVKVERYVIFVLRECIWNVPTISLALLVFDNTDSWVLCIRWSISPGSIAPP